MDSVETIVVIFIIAYSLLSPLLKKKKSMDLLNRRGQQNQFENDSRLTEMDQAAAEQMAAERNRSPRARLSKSSLYSEDAMYEEVQKFFQAGNSESTGQDTESEVRSSSGNANNASGEPGVYRETQTDKAKLVSQRESVQSVFTAEQIASIPASAYDNARTAPTIAINASPYLTDSNDSAKSDYEMIVNKSRAALLREKFVDKNQLREMYIYREIFDKPVALRRQR